MTTPSLPLLAPKAKPLAYSPVLHPIPARAMEKIRSGAYLDFKDLLVDNIALSEQLQELGQAMVLHSPSPGSVKLRNISDPLTWVFCFLQSRKHPGGGWLAYDQLFRQQRAQAWTFPGTTWPPPSWLLQCCGQRTRAPYVTSLTMPPNSVLYFQSLLKGQAGTLPPTHPLDQLASSRM